MASKKQQEPEKLTQELLDELNKRRVGTTPIKKREGEPGARVLDALRAGELVVAIKPFSFDGQNLQIGDTFAPDKNWWPKVAILAQHSFVAPADEYAYGQAHYKLVSFIQNKVDPLKGTWTQRKSETDKAKARIIQLEKYLEEARTAYKDAMFVEADAEMNLRNLLTGEDAQKLLNPGGAE